MAKHRKHRKHARKHRRNPTVANASNPRRRRRRSIRRSHARRTVIVAMNPRRKHRRHRRNPATAANPGRYTRRGRIYRVRPRGRKSRGYRVLGYRQLRRSNPGFSGLGTVALGLLAAVGASVAAGFAVDSFLGNKSNGTQTVVLSGLAVAGAFLIPDVAIATGVATGLLLIPAAKAIYTFLPNLAHAASSQAVVVSAPVPVITGSEVPIGTQAPAGIQALHMGALHMGKLSRRKQQMRALHMGALHMGALRGDRGTSTHTPAFGSDQISKVLAGR